MRSLLDVGGELLAVSQFTLWETAARVGDLPGAARGRASGASVPRLRRAGARARSPGRGGAFRREHGRRAREPRTGHAAPRLIARRASGDGLRDGALRRSTQLPARPTMEHERAIVEVARSSSTRRGVRALGRVERCPAARSGEPKPSPGPTQSPQSIADRWAPFNPGPRSVQLPPVAPFNLTGALR